MDSLNQKKANVATSVFKNKKNLNFNMKKVNLKIALFTVLMLFVGVGFSSCDKMDNEPMASDQNEQLLQISSDSQSLRASRATYTVAQAYKNRYQHYSHSHNIAPGFASWWNCIVKVDGGTIKTPAQVLEDCNSTAPNYELSLATLTSTYSNIYSIAYADIPNDPDNTALKQFENYLKGTFNGGKPCAVLIKNNYQGIWKNVLVIVLTYQSESGGRVYYQDPKASTLGNMTLSDFVNSAKNASSNNVINVLRW